MIAAYYLVVVLASSSGLHSQSIPMKSLRVCQEAQDSLRHDPITPITTTYCIKAK